MELGGGVGVTSAPFMLEELPVWACLDRLSPGSTLSSTFYPGCDANKRGDTPP